MFIPHQTVRLKEDSNFICGDESGTLRKGEIGSIVYVYKNSSRSEVYFNCLLTCVGLSNDKLELT